MQNISQTLISTVRVASPLGEVQRRSRTRESVTLTAEAAAPTTLVCRASCYNEQGEPPQRTGFSAPLW